MGRAAPREIPGPARISQPSCTEPSRSGLPSLPCSHHSDTSFLHMLFIHYTFFPKWRNYSFRRKLPFYVIFILWFFLFRLTEPLLQRISQRPTCISCKFIDCSQTILKSFQCDLEPEGGFVDHVCTTLDDLEAVNCKRSKHEPEVGTGRYW